MVIPPCRSPEESTPKSRRPFGTFNAKDRRLPLYDYNHRRIYHSSVITRGRRHLFLGFEVQPKDNQYNLGHLGRCSNRSLNLHRIRADRSSHSIFHRIYAFSRWSVHYLLCHYKGQTLAENVYHPNILDLFLHCYNLFLNNMGQRC